MLGWEKDAASEWANNTEDQFSTWAETSECDASRTQTLLGLTIQALSGAMVNGDALALVVWLPGKGRQWSIRLQTIEADRLATPPLPMHWSQHYWNRISIRSQSVVQIIFGNHLVDKNN